MNISQCASRVVSYALAWRETQNRKDYDEQEPEEYAKDASGHEHKERGEGGGQFVAANGKSREVSPKSKGVVYVPFPSKWNLMGGPIMVLIAIKNRQREFQRLKAEGYDPRDPENNSRSYGLTLYAKDQAGHEHGEDGRFTAVLITGNPRFIKGNKKADAFYDAIEAHLVKNGYKVTRDPGNDYTEPPKADLWVGHSRGAGRLRFAPSGTKTIAFGSSAEGAINHPNDDVNTPFHLTGGEPPAEHFEFTDAMKSAIESSAVQRRRKDYAALGPTSAFVPGAKRYEDKQPPLTRLLAHALQRGMEELSQYEREYKRDKGGKFASEEEPEREEMGEHTHSSKVQGKLRTLDVVALIKLVRGRKVEKVSLEELDGVDRSKASGFSKKRLEEADTSYPLLVEEKTGELIDGRHRAVKLLDQGKKTAKAHLLSPRDIAVATLARLLDGLSRYKKDASGHEHAPKGKHGGQFVSQGQEDQTDNQLEPRKEPGELAQVAGMTKQMAIHTVIATVVGTIAGAMAWAGRGFIGALGKHVGRALGYGPAGSALTHVVPTSIAGMPTGGVVTTAMPGMERAVVPAIEGSLGSMAPILARAMSRSLSDLVHYVKDKSGHEHAKDGKFTGVGKGSSKLPEDSSKWTAEQEDQANDEAGIPTLGQKLFGKKEAVKAAEKLPSVKNHSVYVMNSKIAGIVPKLFMLHHRSLAFCPKGVQPVGKDGKSHAECKVYGTQPGSYNPVLEPQRHDATAKRVDVNSQHALKHTLAFNQKYNVITNNCQHAVAEIIRRVKEKKIKPDKDKTVFERGIMELCLYVKDATGHEHRGKGKGGGQFISGGAHDEDTRPDWRKRRNTHWSKTEQEGKGKRDPTGRFAPGGGGTNKGKLQEQSSVKGFANKGLIIGLSALAAGLVGTAAAHQAGMLPEGIGKGIWKHTVGTAHRWFGGKSTNQLLAEQIKERELRAKLDDKGNVPSYNDMLAQAYIPPQKPIDPDSEEILPRDIGFNPDSGPKDSPPSSGVLPETIDFDPVEVPVPPPAVSIKPDENEMRRANWDALLNWMASRKKSDDPIRGSQRLGLPMFRPKMKPPKKNERDLYELVHYEAMNGGMDSTQASFLAAEADYNARCAPRQTGPDFSDPQVREATANYLRQIGYAEADVEAEMLSLAHETVALRPLSQ